MSHVGDHRRCQRQQGYPLGVWPRHVLPLVLVLSLLEGSILGCGSDTTGPAPLSANQAYWALQLNYQAVNMATVAPADTVRLIATPLNVAGTPLMGLGSATFQTSDSTVTVDSTGLMTAHFATQGQPTPVSVSLKAQGITLTDTVLVQVSDTIPHHALATFSMQPAPGDSAKRTLDLATFTWPVTATDAARNIICNSIPCPLLVSYTSSNPLVATIDNTGMVTASDTGHVVFTAATWAYGVAKRDSVAFTIGYRLDYLMYVADAGSSFVMFLAPKNIVLGVGATVTFVCAPPRFGPRFRCTSPIDVVFDDSAAVDTATDDIFGAPPTGTGNIPAFGADSVNPHNDVRARRFPVAGTYHYHSSVLASDSKAFIIKEQR